MWNRSTQVLCAVLGAAVFCILLGKVTLIGGLLGIACALAAAYAVRPVNCPSTRPFSGPWLAGYYVHLVREMLLSTLSLMRALLQKTPPALKIVRLTPHAAERGRVLVANSITLTPGTVTLEEGADAYTILCLAIPGEPGAAVSSFEDRLHQEELRV